MQILILSGGLPDSKNPGNGIFEYDQAKALTKAGHSVTYFVIDLRSILRKRTLGIHYNEQDGIKISRISLPVGAVPDGMLFRIGSLALSILYNSTYKETIKPDIIHAHFLGLGYMAVSLARRKHIQLVITEHSSGINRDGLTSAYIRRMKYVYQNSAVVIAVSKALATRIHQYTKIEAEVIPNIVDTTIFFSEGQSSGSFKKQFKFIAAGNLISGKGFDTLLRAFKAIMSIHPDTYLLIMGNGPERDALEDLSIQLGLRNNVEFYGAYVRNEFAQQLKDSAAFVLASRGETFGVAYVEAMASGLPVIATRCGGPEDFVLPFNGILVPIQDERALVDAMVFMLHNAMKYDRKQISEYVRMRFAPERIANELIGLYRHVLGEQNENG